MNRSPWPSRAGGRAPIAGSPATVSARPDFVSTRAAVLFVPILALSVGAWIMVAKGGAAGFATGFALAVSMPALAAILVVMGRSLTALQALAYMVAVEPAVRTFVPGFPYLGIAYSVLVISLLLALRLRAPFRLSGPFLAYALYFALEATGTLRAGSMIEARAVLIPSAVLLSLLAASGKISLDGDATNRVIGAYLLGILTLAGATLPGYFSGSVTWGAQSNFAATAGMGPNQLSLLYSGAIFLCLTLARRASRSARVGLWAAALLLLLLMVLTFSRGGLYILAGGLAVGLLLTPRSVIRTLFVIAGYSLAAVALYFVVVQVTQGRVIDRYSDLDTSNRARLAEVGWQMFESSPLTGVGTGNYYAVAESPEYFGMRSGAHNELTRSAAEHGLPGVGFWVAFVLAALWVAHRTRVRERRVTRVVLLLMAIVTTLYNGLKLVAQPFLIFLALTAYADRRGSLPGAIQGGRLRRHSAKAAAGGPPRLPEAPPQPRRIDRS